MEFPKKCPYCGKDIVPNEKTSLGELDGKSPSQPMFGLSVEIHRCIHCHRAIFVIKEELKKESYYLQSKIIFYYPTITTVDFPKRIKELSPNAYNTYEQTIKAKEQGFDMLVGAGLRIALEWLVWDYLIKIKDCKEEDIDKLTLSKRIEKMNNDFYTQVCARLIRLFGNDSVHIIKQLDFSSDEVIEVFDMLCALIDNELQIKEVNDRLSATKPANGT
ncbi:MAG: hypothetical protein J1E81_10320 [Eubacterium sp.]|nr:hypothetical protein [Eubacterium sp.]